MLQLKNVKKDYYVGELVVSALKGVSIDFRKNEFVAILGQSGCGKTTLMNVIGGLDRLTDGDILLNGKSTVAFKETDWDEYRNSKIGFVFQNYNLIPHLNVLLNVELALTISGVTGEERTRRAKHALDRVGLENQYNKRPNQLSGGQMQRVAIARAIVNEPDILLADEPTGAIDSETSVQIMNILKEIAEEKLVIMVTHNSELAEEFATRIVKILDGEIISDSNPVEIEIEPENDVSKKNNIEQSADADNKTEKMNKRRKKKGATMSLFTSFKLSWKNLINKRGRSILTAVAGSIGIISIALILAVNNGFNYYIDTFEKQSMSKYPITISSGEFSMISMFEEFLGGDELDGDSMDISSILGVFNGDNIDGEKFTAEEMVYVYGQFVGMFEAMRNNISKETDISVFKKHLERKFDYSLGTVKYDYSINLNIFKQNAVKESETSSNTPATYTQLNPLSESDTIAPLLNTIMGSDADSDTIARMGSALNSFAFWDELIADDETITQQYSVLAGHLPTNENEIVLVTDEYNQISDFEMFTLNELGVLDLISAMTNPSRLNNFNKEFDEIIGKEYYILPTGAAYVLNTSTGLYDNVKDGSAAALSSAIESKGIKVRISAILRPKEGVDGGCINGVIGYTSALADKVVEDANNCDYVKAQMAEYAAYLAKIEAALPIQERLLNDGNLTEDDLTMQEKLTLATALAATIKDVSTGESLTESAYKTLLTDLNVRDLNKPAYIYIYPSAINNKSAISKFISDFNAERTAEEEAAEALAKENDTAVPTVTNVVQFKDDLDSIVNELNGLVNTITYILIAVALVSVFVTMLLIAIIMYISVQDRTREIGILRALGARKFEISNIFNAETTLLGLASGLLGVLLSFVLQFPVNVIFANTLGIQSLLQIAWWHPLVLIFGAIIITVVSGLIPASLAANKDPVNALRAE